MTRKSRIWRVWSIVTSIVGDSNRMPSSRFCRIFNIIAAVIWLISVVSMIPLVIIIATTD